MKDIIKIFKTLADPTRLRVLLLLRRKDLCVCELMYVLGLEQSLVSHHMRVLREAGLAEDLRDGRWIIYRVPETARPLLDGLFAGALHDRLELTPEAAADASRLEDCVRQDVRGCLCEARPNGEA